MAAPTAASKSETTARIVWETADKFLRNIVDEEDYGDFIMPFTALRRLECMLTESKEEVTEFIGSLGAAPAPGRHRGEGPVQAEWVDDALYAVLRAGEERAHPQTVVWTGLGGAVAAAF